MSQRSTLLLEHHLKELRLPSFLREYGKMAARLRRSSMRRWRSMSPSSARRSRFRVVRIPGGALGGHFVVLPEEAGQPQLFQVVFQHQVDL